MRYQKTALCYDRHMKYTRSRNKNTVRVICISFAVLLVAVSSVLFIRSKLTASSPSSLDALTSNEKQIFPEIDQTHLPEEQVKLIAILKEGYALNPEGTKYSEGIDEAWCADFVSWVYRSVGTPLKNPYSGSWRIPGTYTLREYYESIGTFRPVNSDYTPKVGDILLYDDPSPFGQHTNIVLKYDNGTVTTIGGNEPGGIRIIEHTLVDDPGFIGYGVM